MIRVKKGTDTSQLEKQGILHWPVWSKEVSEFPWYYDAEEVCYFLQGKVEVKVDGQPPVLIGSGDLVTFPAGLSCVWKIIEPVKKHYTFR